MPDCQFFNLRLTTIFYRYTKSRLFRDKITENDKYYLCSGSQTLVHLFADCVCFKIFVLILLLGGILKITRISGSNSVIFYMHFIQENSPF